MGAGLPRRLTAREPSAPPGRRRQGQPVAAVLVISEHYVTRHLQNIFAKLGVSAVGGRDGLRLRARARLSSCPAVVEIHHGRRRQVGWFRH